MIVLKSLQVTLVLRVSRAHIVRGALQLILEFGLKIGDDALVVVGKVGKIGSVLGLGALQLIVKVLDLGGVAGLLLMDGIFKNFVALLEV